MGGGLHLAGALNRSNIMSTSTKLTIKEVKLQLKLINPALTLRKREGEYRVGLHKSSYFTDDLEDALGTAKVMAAFERNKIE